MIIFMLSSRAPTDCLQYLTGVSNSFKSFNFGNLMIRNLQYDVCIRPESGYCRFQLLESSSTTDSFKIDPASTTTTSKVKLSLKFIYSEKATKFCEIFTGLLTTVHTVKINGKISQNFVAFSEYMNFNDGEWQQ